MSGPFWALVEVDLFQYRDGTISTHYLLSPGNALLSEILAARDAAIADWSHLPTGVARIEREAAHARLMAALDKLGPAT